MAEERRNRLTLDSLSSDIIDSILDWITLERPSIGETRPVRYESLVPGEYWHTFTRNRRGLVGLCRVSKKFCAYAQPLLYRTVAILSEPSLVLFFRTINEQPVLGRSFTRSFSCHLTLTNAAREVREALQQHFPTCTDVYSFDGMSDRTPESVLSYILCRLPRLETLLLQVPIWNENDLYLTLLTDLLMVNPRTWCQDCADLGSWPSCPTHKELGLDKHVYVASLPRECPFTQLDTLMIQGDPEAWESIEETGPLSSAEYYGASACNYAPLYSISPKLQTLEISCDDGNFDFYRWAPVAQEKGEDMPLVEAFRHIYLHDSFACPRALHSLLRHAPNLETLYMTPRLDEDMVNEWRWHSNGNDEQSESLDLALARYGKKLRHLDVSWFEHHGHPNLIGSKGRLASLPTLKNMETLCAQLVVLYGTDPAGLLMPLASLLPPNLVELTLVDWWWSDIDAYDEMNDWRAAEELEHYRSKKAYRSNALSSLMQFAHDHSQPRLKKVMLTCPIPWTWRIPGGEGPEGLNFHFREVEEAFARRGVEFLVEEA